MRVQDVVLVQEYGVEDDALVAQRELDRVAREAAPVPLQGRVEQQLRHGQHAPRHVEQVLPS